VDQSVPLQTVALLFQAQGEEKKWGEKRCPKKVLLKFDNAVDLGMVFTTFFFYFTFDALIVLLKSYMYQSAK
jgi:hypothetical protein